MEPFVRVEPFESLNTPFVRVVIFNTVQPLFSTKQFRENAQQTGLADHDIVGEGVRLVRNGRVAIRWSRPRLLLEPFVRVEPSFHFISNLFALSRSSLSEAVFLKMGLADHDIVGEGACLVREHDLVQCSGSRVQECKV